MKLSGQQKLVLLMSVMAVLWSLSHGCPIDPGSICAEELPNAISVISRLKKTLKDFCKTFLVCTRADSSFFSEEPCLPLDLGSSSSLLIDISLFYANDEGGFGIIEFRGPVCVGGFRDQPLDLDTRLCQYTKCFQHYAGIVGEDSTLKPSIEYCQKYLNQLENIIKKMTRHPSASCTTHCRISWSSTDTRWHELTKGPHLAQELLTYLEQLNLSCS